MSKHLVIGAGPTGTATAQLLADAGDTVLLVSRQGRGPRHPRIELRALDAANPAAVGSAADDVATIFNCAMPRYDRWPQEFPPIARSVLAAARASGAAVVTLSNVYGYGAAPPPFTEATPIAPTTVKGRVRAQMWTDALASGGRVTEVRAGDYLGHGAASLFTLMVLPALRAGALASMPGDLDGPHSWSFTGDVARTLVAAARHEASWGRAWHVPSNTASVRAITVRLAELGELPRPTLSRMSGETLAAIGEEDPIAREVIEMLYLFEEPSLLDATETTHILGIQAAPLDEVLRDTLRA